MIKIQSDGRLGNKLHYFILGMIVSEITNMSFSPEKIDGFEKTYGPIIKETKDYNYKNISDFNIWSDDFYDKVKSHDGGIIINCMFGKYKQISNFSEKIKEWLQIENEESFEKPNSDDLIIHIRLDDYLQIGCVSDKDLYLEVIKNENFNRCFILTDSPGHQYLNEFINIGCIIRSKSTLDDFVFMKNANKIVISKSTFSWTSAIISNAEKIYFPLSDNKWPYYLNPTYDQVDLFPYDRKEWIKL